MLKPSTRSKRPQAAGKFGNLIFGIFWTAFSSIFLFVGLGMFFSGATKKYSEAVPCSVTRFEIVSAPDDDEPFRVELEFEYQHEGRRYTGDRLSPGSDSERSFEKLAKLREEFFRNDEVIECYLDPENPDDAVLLRRSAGNWFALFFAAFGGGFVLIGVGIILKSIRARRSGGAVSDQVQNRQEMGGVVGCGFFGVFAAAGLGIFAGLVLPAGVKYFSALGWVETPAEVIWSRVRSSTDSDGTTYRADVFYRYQFQGVEHRSNSYSLLGTSSSSGRSGKQRIVEAHPSGSPIICYVNPRDPTEALVERGLGWWALFGLFPVPFIAIGLGGLYYTFFGKGKRERANLSVSAPSNWRTDRLASKPTGKRRSPLARRLLASLGALALALFWNGIVSVFVWQIWEGWKTGNMPWFLAVFMVPFVLIGIGLLVHFFYRLFAIFSPVFDVTLRQNELVPGHQQTIAWRRTGGSGSPKRVTLWLVGKEVAEYRRGTSTAVAEEVFYEERLFETTDRLVIPSGRCNLTIPESAVPTFSGRYNKIRWLLVLRADVPWRPDVREEYELQIQPGKEFGS